MDRRFEYLSVVTDGSKGLIRAFLLGEGTSNRLEKLLREPVRAVPYQVFVISEEKLGWVGDGHKIFQRFPSAIRMAQLPLKKMFRKVGESSELGYGELDIVLGRLGLVAAAVSFDNLKLEDGELYIGL
jgi:hypothetical protein